MSVSVLQTSDEWQSRWSTQRAQREWGHQARNTRTQLSTNIRLPLCSKLYVQMS